MSKMKLEFARQEPMWQGSFLEHVENVGGEITPEIVEHCIETVNKALIPTERQESWRTALLVDLERHQLGETISKGPGALGTLLVNEARLARERMQ